MKLTRQQIKEMARISARYPATLELVPDAEWPPEMADARWPRLAVYRSRKFLVQVIFENGFIRLSVNRTEWDFKAGRWREDISWDDLQRLKAEAGFGHLCAVEVFPPDGAVVNVANMRHLFLLSEPPPFMWRNSQ